MENLLFIGVPILKHITAFCTATSVGNKYVKNRLEPNEWLNLLSAGANFHGPKPVRSIKVLLQINENGEPHMLGSLDLTYSFGLGSA